MLRKLIRRVPGLVAAVVELGSIGETDERSVRMEVGHIAVGAVKRLKVITRGRGKSSRAEG